MGRGQCRLTSITFFGTRLLVIAATHPQLPRTPLLVVSSDANIVILRMTHLCPKGAVRG